MKNDILRHFSINEPTTCGMSGGRTSAMMHLLHIQAGGPAPYSAAFCNTGKEVEATLRFVQEVSDHGVSMGGPPVVWLEYTAPEPGKAPKEAGYRVVDFNSASRKGEPFEAMLQALADYRRIVKDAPPVVPGARMRLCTSYLKIQPSRYWARDNGFIPGVRTLGIRADEPERAGPLLAVTTRSGHQDAACPMFSAGITGADVSRFWAKQSYKLECAVAEGNCTLCHLKSEARLARAALLTGDEAWWTTMGERFGPFRRDRASYAQIAAEAPARMDIAAALAGGPAETPAILALDPRRRKLITTQERRYAAGDDPYSCSCAVVDSGGVE